MKYRKKIKLNVRSKDWTFFVLKYSDYVEVVGEDSRAITDLEKHEVYFSDDYLTLPIIRHELTHVFIESYSHYNVEYTNEQLEEVLCSIVEYYFDELDRLARLIKKRLTK